MDISGMKRYDFSNRQDLSGEDTLRAIESNDGDFVMYEDAKDEIDRLRELLIKCDMFIDSHYGGINEMKERIITR